MTSLLAIETSTAACSVALRKADRIISRYSQEPRSHTRLIMPMVHDVLQEADLTVQQLNGIGVAIGPGSFTGLRIGFATVQGLCFGGGIPVVGVSTLQVMAATYLRQYRPNITYIEGTVIFSVLDARMGEFNCGCYRIDARGQLAPLIDDQLLSASQALALIERQNPNAIVGDADQLIDKQSAWTALYTSLYPDAIDLLEITATGYNQGLAVPIETIELIYLRGTEAWQKSKPLRVK